MLHSPQTQRRVDEEMDESQVVEGKMDWKGRPANKKIHGGFKPALFVLMLSMFNSFGWVAASGNLVTYFTSVMHFNTADASNTLTTFMGASYLLTLLGAYLADAHVGRCKVLVISVMVYISGLVLLTVQAHLRSLQPPPCNMYDPKVTCEKVHGANAAVLFIALYVAATGLAGLSASLPAHGADQFDDKDPKESRQMSSFFNYFTASTSIGSILSLTLVVWIQTHVGWDWGFGVTVMCVVVGTGFLLAGVPKYRIHIIRGTNPILEIAQVLVAAIRNIKRPFPKDAIELYEIDKDTEAANEAEFLPHRDIMRFLDKAAIRKTGREPNLNEAEKPNPWKLCRVTQVENTKTIVGMLPIFVCSIFMSTCLAQLQTFTIQQGFTMDNHMGKHITIAPANLALAPYVFVAIGIPIYDRLVVPFIRKFTGHPNGITTLQRIGVGLLLACLSMTVAGIVEVKRKNVAKSNGMLDANSMMEKLPISIFWLVFQHFIFGISDMFAYVGLIEFFYSEAPKTMKSIATAFVTCSLGLGYFISSILVDVVNHATKHNTKNGGWLAGNNLNRMHLELFYWTLAIITLLNFFNYLFWSKRYEYKRQQPPTTVVPQS